MMFIYKLGMRVVMMASQLVKREVAMSSESRPLQIEM